VPIGASLGDPRAKFAPLPAAPLQPDLGVAPRLRNIVDQESDQEQHQGTRVAGKRT